MKKLGIQYLKISHFKSIDSLELRNINHFSVFAGANGSGKSNFFDALDFVSRLIRVGLTDALRGHGGFENIRHPEQRFEFEIKYSLPNNENWWYCLGLQSFSDKPEIEERILLNSNLLFERKTGQSPYLNSGETKTPIDGFSANYSGLHLFSETFLMKWLSNFHLYRLEPKRALAQFEQDSSLLTYNGQNLPSVLRRLEQNDDLRETILEWMETVVPGIQQIKTERQPLNGGTAILFKEHGTDKPFPAQMMSEGTIYALCLLVAVLDTPSEYGLTLIEEPERGLHPQAIFEFIDFIRTQASISNPIWMTTHSESVVRQLQLDELWLTDKKNGITQVKAANCGRLQQEDLAPLGVDEAWLSNLLGGGLPW
ncbi:hypothetical protein PN36_14170 [Candidatus Thiomargarita nelsonii]|uniref:ATPase AAA-type core domain-containing protein n=1 Tax=Candidatus Thiomargarita nelsonii TaxID=1003181 RepID=A0A0A6PB40_9GAMM|nr:hypothetical protein PN36_14170 [Candidatus Thiomargarita nelsonii]